MRAALACLVLSLGLQAGTPDQPPNAFDTPQAFETDDFRPEMMADRSLLEQLNANGGIPLEDFVRTAKHGTGRDLIIGPKARWEIKTSQQRNIQVTNPVDLRQHPDLFALIRAILKANDYHLFPVAGPAETWLVESLSNSCPPDYHFHSPARFMDGEELARSRDWRTWREVSTLVPLEWLPPYFQAKLTRLDERGRIRCYAQIDQIDKLLVIGPMHTLARGARRWR